MKTIKELLRKAGCPNPTGVAFAIDEIMLGLIDKMPYNKEADCLTCTREELKKRINGRNLN